MPRRLQSNVSQEKKDKKIKSYSHNLVEKLKSLCCFGNNCKYDEDDTFSTVFEGLKEASKNFSIEERLIFDNLLQFIPKVTNKVIIPRSNICGVDVSWDSERIIDIVSQHVHTRTMVYNDNMDNIIGFIHIKDLFVLLTNKSKFDINKIMRKPLVAAPSMKLIDLLVQMQSQRTHVAVILDEYGGTGGIVTIEDIIEEIIGQIDDEHDKHHSHKNLYFIEQNVVVANARTSIEEVELHINRKLVSKDSDVETIGGLVLSKVGYVPKKGEIITISEDVVAEIMDANPKSIAYVKLIMNQPTKQ